MNPHLVLEALQRCPAHQSTRLLDLSSLAQELGVEHVWAKDESNRMGLGSFKALGGAYAVYRLLQESSDTAPSTFVCASAGNHGLSVAVGARVFGARARIYLAESVPQAFHQRLLAEGAEVVVWGQTYEQAMARAQQDAQDEGWVLLADSSWPGYGEVPALVMEGYTVIGHELAEQFREQDRWPTRVFLQAGVGGLAAALAHHIRACWPEQPEIVVVEPERAPCLKESVERGELVEVQGPSSNMGRLDCKVPSELALEILRDKADRFLLVNDDEASRSVELLKGLGVVTTPSGAAGVAGLWACRDELKAQDRPLVLISEGKPD